MHVFTFVMRIILKVHQENLIMYSHHTQDGHKNLSRYIFLSLLSPLTDFYTILNCDYGRVAFCSC